MPLGIEIGTTFANRMAIRDDLHCHNRAGISRSANDRIVVLVSDPTRKKRHRYRDRLLPNGEFLFYGQRPRNDDPNNNNNPLVREHVGNGDALALFVKEGDAYVFRGEWTYRGETAERNGQIVFYLTAGGAQADNVFDELVEQMFEDPDLRKKAYEAANEAPDRRGGTRTRFRRSAAIVAWAIKRSEGRCEAKGCAPPFFKENRLPFLEVHHIGRLADGGPDHPLNVGAVCPNCHRALHFAPGHPALNQRLREEVARREDRVRPADL